MDDPVLRWRGAHPDPVESIGQVPVVASAVWSVGEPAHPDCQLGEQLGRSASPEADIAGRTLKGILHRLYTSAFPVRLGNPNTALILLVVC